MYNLFIRFTLLTGACFLCVFSLFAQYPDDYWLLGYDGDYAEQDGFGLVQLDFTGNQLTIGEEMEIPIRLGRNISLISTPAGDSILFYFNGLQVNTGAHELAVNGDDMYVGQSDLGYDVTQGSVLLPWPGQTSSRYLLLNMFAEYNLELSTRTGYEMNYSVIETEPQVEVIEKNIVMEQGSLHAGQLTATRHANGRDWWVIWPYWDSDQYMRFLFTPQGLVRLEDGVLDQAIRSGSGQSRFSPDGRYFAMHNGINGEVGNFFDLFDFDRCTGLLSNQQQYNIDYYGGGIGIEISHDSHFLYISSGLYIYQLDLWAEDVFASIDTVAVYDGVQAPFSTAFNDAQLARDGKIYLSGASSMQKLHVIDYPNRQGAACNVRQRGIDLPVRNSFGVPNFPFHRLGPLDGSACDTLGIDNVPLADFRSDQDTSDHLSFFFQNLSTYEPATWAWSFGDGSMSADTSPVYTYAQGGSYEVCLTVSNAYGTDTTCDSLHLAIVNSVEPAAPSARWQVFPNPAREYFTFNLLDYYPREAYLELYNSMGQRVRRERVFAGWNTVEIGELPGGIYSFVVVETHPKSLPAREGLAVGGQEIRLASGKVVKVE